MMEIYHIAQERMIATGNPTQWAHSYPTEELIKSDINAGISYVIESDGIVHAVFMLMDTREPTYTNIDGTWLNDAPYLTVHRVASDGRMHGVVSTVLDYCKESGCESIRIDTHENNLIMQHQIEKNGFKRCGIVYMEDGSPGIAYQWVKGMG